MGTCSFCETDQIADTGDSDSRPLISRPEKANSVTDTLQDTKEEEDLTDKAPLQEPEPVIETEDITNENIDVEAITNDSQPKTDENTDPAPISDERKEQSEESQDTKHHTSAEFEATIVYNWLNDAHLDTDQLKQRLAGLLSSRSDDYRQQLNQLYRSKYDRNVEKDIRRLLKKGPAMEMIHALLMTRAQYDAMLISEYIKKRDIEPVADIICCRTMPQIKEIAEAYKEQYILDLKGRLQALAQKDNKKTLVTTVTSIFDADRKENMDIDMDAVKSDVDFVLTTKSFKGQNKEKLVLIFTQNSEEYIKLFNAQFVTKSKDGLVAFVEKKMGSKSKSGYFCKTRIEYALDIGVYYAIRINKLGKQFKKNENNICGIFRQRMEIDLDLIQNVWSRKQYGNGKQLKEWILVQANGSESGVFLSKMLEHVSNFV